MIQGDGEQMGSFYVYILECSDRTLYTGRTNDIERRVREHNDGTGGAAYTRHRRPVRLVYIERYSSRSDALRREAAIKRLSRAQKIRLIEASGRWKTVF